MKKVYPYRTAAGALRALDNGGRFYHLFSRAGDDVITPAELRRVAGAFGDDRPAAAFFALALSALDRADQDRVRAALGPETRNLLRWYEPRAIEPARFATDAKAGKPYVVEGPVQRFDDETRTGVIFVPLQVGSVMTVTPIPIQSRFTVYQVGDAEPGAECLVLTPKQAVQLTGRRRFAGIAKEAETPAGARTAKRLRLEALCYCDA